MTRESATAAHEQLLGQSTSFAKEISASVEAFVGKPQPFEAVLLKGSAKVSVTEDDASGIPVNVNGLPLLSLAISYHCTWDSRGKYLAIESSKIAVHAGEKPKGDPLFRYEYERGSPAHIPAAHLHVHAHRDQLTHVMSLAGQAGAPRRQVSTESAAAYPRMAELHFPLGGHRFRPCLEDILAFIHLEFNVDTGPEWMAVLNEARAIWRRRQLAAAVRDCPDECARVLGELGWSIGEPPSNLRAPSTDRLQAL